MKPLLAHVYEPKRVTYPCYVQPKLNGIRALFQGGFFQSRDEVPFTPGLLDHLAKPLLKIFGPEIILDGELYVHGWPLQRINAAVTPVRQEPTEDTKLVEYHIFDVVDFKIEFIRRFDWQRLSWQAQMMSPNTGPIKFVQTSQVCGEGEANSLYVHWVSLGYEGMMYRLGDCPYTVPKQMAGIYQCQWKNIPAPRGYYSDQDNRVWHLLKRKDWQDAEFLCIGTTEGEGKYQGMIGALTCYVNLIEKITFTVSGGLTDLQRQQPPEDFIGKTIKTKYLCLSSDGIPLNPTILAIL